jgi:DNA polymerase I-like protein with 3'-5' exonuclease and polymerase domains
MENPMKLLPAWENRVQKVKSEPVARRMGYVLRKSPQYYAMKTKFVETLEGAQAMLDFAFQRPLSHIGFDTEFRYELPGVMIDKRNTKYDPTSIRPFLLSLAMAEPIDDKGGCLYTFVIDLRIPALMTVLKELFRLPILFVGHFAKVELFCLWKLRLPEPPVLWDTFIFEKLLRLGQHHHKYKLQKFADEFEQIQAKEETREKKVFGLSLVATCQRYDVPYRMEVEKERLQKTFLTHPDGAHFSEEQIEYSAEDAIAAAKIYPRQIQVAVQNGLLHHCQTVEMAWVITNAQIEWAGVRVDEKKRGETITRINVHLDRLKKHLAAEYGIENTRSHKQLVAFFRNRGLLHKFQTGSKVSFDKKALKKNDPLHPAIALLRASRRASDLLADKLLSPDFVGEDGRVHAEHRQLGTDTGRQTSRWPNLLGLDRVLRPLVIPEPGYGIGEVDWSQVEVGVAAAFYGDDELVRMFNSGDVYSAMAQHFFRDKLPVEDRGSDGKEFKGKHRELRNQMKSCTLGIIYGITPVGLAQTLGTTKTKAAELQDRFMAMFPRLREALLQASRYGAIRGYAHTISGLKRYRGRSGEAIRWEKNWLTNHPVQGSAAVVFKEAGNRLDKLYRQYNARIIIPVHDAFIFEAPLDALESVAGLTSRVMCDTLQEYFPALRPQVEVNISRPDCWNKDGAVGALEKWMGEMDNIMP